MRPFAFIVVVAMLAISGVAQQSRTLTNLLLENGIPYEGLPAASLQRVIGDSASRTEGSRFTIAYYTVPKDSSPLWIRSYDKQKHYWISKSFARVSDLGSGTMDVCLGSLEDVELTGNNLIVRTHVSPSAECTIVFSSSLGVKRTIYGWIVATTRSRLSLIQHSEVHFAPTHPVELSVYDHPRNTLVQIFPPKNDPLRNEFMEYLRSHRDLDWCRQNNSHCDPERFGADLGDISAGVEGDSFAFYITFPPEGYSAPSSEKREVMYVFLRRGHKWEYREFPKESAPYTLNDAVSPLSLTHIFADQR